MVSECWYVLQFLGHWMGYVINVWTTRQVLCLYIGWCLPMLFFAYGRCYCHAFCCRCYCHCYVFLLADIIAIFCWLVLLPWFVYCKVCVRCYCHCGCCCWHLWEWSIILLQMLWPFLGWCECPAWMLLYFWQICILQSLWQMSLPLWLLLLPLVGMMYHSITDVMAIFRVMWVTLLECCCISGRCYHHYGWWYCTIYENFVIIRCCLPGGQMQQPTKVGVWSDVITMSGTWNSH